MVIPTKRALVIIGAGLVLYLLAWRSVVGWFYVANAIVWAMLLLNLVASWWSLRGLYVTRRLRAKDTRDLFEDDTVQVEPCESVASWQASGGVTPWTDTTVGAGSPEANKSGSS